MTAPELSFVFELRVLVGPPIDIGSGPDGRHRMVPILGGFVEGAEMKAVVIPGGFDWQRIRSDGTFDIEARYAIRTEDGAFISIVNQGVRHASPSVMDRLANGEPVDQAEYYFRTTPRFQAAEGPYYWLTKSLF